MKKITFGLIIGFLLGMSVFTFATEQQLIKLVVNGNNIVSDVPPQNINGRVMIPARALAESLGAKVVWDAENNTVVVTSNLKQPNAVQSNPVIKPSELPSTPTQEDLVKKEIDSLNSSGINAVNFKGMPAIIVDGQTWFSLSFYGNKFYKLAEYGFNSDTKKLLYRYSDDNGNKVTITITDNDDSLRVYLGRSYINSKYYREP